MIVFDKVAFGRAASPVTIALYRANDKPKNAAFFSF